VVLGVCYFPATLTGVAKDIRVNGLAETIFDGFVFSAEAIGLFKSICCLGMLLAGGF
jgi:hypothetical protein